MNTRTPYFFDTKVRARGSELFFVDPNVTNEGRLPPVPGSMINYRYKLPFLAHNFPVRQIRMLYPELSLNLSPQITTGTNCFLTLRKADGSYLLDRVPLSLFLTNTGTVPTRRPILFDRDFFPDPQLSFLQWTTAGDTGRAAIEFIYG